MNAYRSNTKSSLNHNNVSGDYYWIVPVKTGNLLVTTLSTAAIWSNDTGIVCLTIAVASSREITGLLAPTFTRVDLNRFFFKGIVKNLL